MLVAEMNQVEIFNMVMQFKEGDVIEPACEHTIAFPNWYGLTVISYDENCKTATVKYKDGRIFEHFNLDPKQGVPFKCVNHS